MRQNEVWVWVAVAIGAGAALLHARGYRFDYKAGVLLMFSPEMAGALPLIELAHQDAGIGFRYDDAGRQFSGAYFTSGSEGHSGDGVHGPFSAHYAGNATDLRTRDLTRAKTDALGSALRSRLPAAFHVIDETRTAAPHYHVQFGTAGMRV